MEFLDEAAEKRHRIMLFVGYGLLAVAIGIGLLLLIYRSWYGYSLNLDGEVEQSGLVFLSSNPEGATITANGKVLSDKTNARISLENGSYNIAMNAEGYRPWEHTIDVQGGDVQHFTYPLLFPKKLVTKSVGSFAPGTQLFSVSPNRRWLVVKENDAAAAATRQFAIYDLKDAAAPVVTEYALPATAYTAGANESWTTVEWSADNRHILLLHTYDASGSPAHEYIMLDRSDAAASRNLTQLLSLSADETLTLFNKKYDQYYGFTASTGVLRAFSQGGEVLRDQLEHVKAYMADGSGTLLYVTDLPESGKQAAGTVNVMLLQGSKRLLLRRMAADAERYLLSVAQYDGTWYVAVAASGDKGAYIYRDPFNGISSESTALPQPWRFLRLDKPALLTFSGNSRFLLVGNAQNCAVYDAELAAVRHFSLDGALDAPQTTASWLDSYRLSYVSNGIVRVMDYDHQNAVQLQAGLGSQPVFFSSNTKYLLSFSAGADGEVRLDATALTVKK